MGWSGLPKVIMPTASIQNFTKHCRLIYHILGQNQPTRFEHHLICNELIEVKHYATKLCLNWLCKTKVEVSINGGTIQWIVYSVNPINMDDLGVPAFVETTIWIPNLSAWNGVWCKNTNGFQGLGVPMGTPFSNRSIFHSLHGEHQEPRHRLSSSAPDSGVQPPWNTIGKWNHPKEKMANDMQSSFWIYLQQYHALSSSFKDFNHA